MLLRNRSLAVLLALLAATSLGAVGCSSTDSSSEEDDGALMQDEGSSGWTMDIAKMNASFPDEALPIREAEDAYRVLVKIGDKTIPANTHLFTEHANIIPYANEDVEAQVATATGGRGDAVIAEYIKPGEVGLMIKHHRPDHRTLVIGGAGDDMKENFKLQDSHIGLILGVERNGKPGAISVNNPKGYEQGGFGNDHYPMVFVKPTFPQGISEAQKQLYLDNIRTMAVLFNTVSTFPGDYNGGDPLAAHNPTEIKRHVAMMVKAIGGDTAAQEWFQDARNKIYCAELAFVSLSAGILVPLTESAVVGLEGEGSSVTREDWQKFTAAIDSGWPFAQAPIPSVEQSPNGRLAHLAKYKPDFQKLSQLRPISEVVPAPKRADGAPGHGLAFEPMTMADIVQHFLRLHVPRDPEFQGGPLRGAGESVAPMQAGVLAAMEDGLMERMHIPAGDAQRSRSITDNAALAQLPAQLMSGQRVAFTVKDVFDGILSVVGKSYGNYAEFQKNIQPWLFVARNVTGPKRADSGEGLFAPPSLYHVVAQGSHPGGYLGLKYLGHGLHFQYAKPPAGGASPAAPAAPAAGGGDSHQEKAPQGRPANPVGDP